ncbi:hypothetical protein NCAS_0C05000 [Naumovozyma castellii]|uniref:Uncharacterized protein n=1 Tax=Naumovozyma castellii TaxID=27288 RepID=G0VDC8_NAUCA|nr:hypothetical protein NCAS_0C05000 [Naumovozyma castellii CBS 4309]CCC69490.1 hypothetical protein NCAS_0C05000 [Naumovozyma castellii CBS 4309]
MPTTTIVQLICGLISAAAILYQRRYNKIHRSIYGLSYDLYTFDLLGHLISVYCSLNYKFSPLTRTQLSNRFPLFYPLEDPKIPISSWLVLTHLIIIASGVSVFRQLLAYRSTKHIYQGISLTVVILLSIFSLLAVFTFACSCLNFPKNMGKYGIFYLDHINYLWLAGNIMLTFKFVPQISLNWMGLSTSGVSSKYVILNLLNNLISILEYHVFSKIVQSDLQWWQYPFNYKPIFVSWIQLVSIIIILYQAQFLYVRSNVYLPKGKGSSLLL